MAQGSRPVKPRRVPRGGRQSRGGTANLSHAVMGTRQLCKPWRGLEGWRGLSPACTLNFGFDLLSGLGAAVQTCDFSQQLPGAGASLSWEWEGSGRAGRTGRGGGSGAGLCTRMEGGDSWTRPHPVGCTQPHGPPPHPPNRVPGLGTGRGGSRCPPQLCCRPSPRRSLPTLNGSCSDPAVLRFLSPLQHPPRWQGSPVLLCRGPPSP